MNKNSILSRYSWITLAYNVMVILWGVFVRATGSGAGCGSHWPTCNGTVVPRQPQLNTLIEFVHRMSSSLALVMVVVLVIWVLRSCPRGHQARLWAVLSLAFTLAEALVGAGLVLFGLTGDDQSAARVVVMALHLSNTLLLLGSLTMTAWTTAGNRILSYGIKGVSRYIITGMIIFFLLGGAGAVTALGDTLFRPSSLMEGINADLSQNAHILVELRVIHPILAILAACFALWVGRKIINSRRIFDGRIRNITRFLFLLILAQLIIGVINIVLLVPVWTQLIHMAVSDGLWITTVLLAAQSWSIRENPDI